ncbi:MAG: hypothetical protein Q7U82_09720 [Gammaproteobacteria bacterium]|nr:hypothetical protein [Gammaproteobacteria bacterium]
MMLATLSSLCFGAHRTPRFLLLALLPLLLTACAQNQPAQVVGPPPVGNVTLNVAAQTPAEERLLNIGVQVFDTRATDEQITQAGAAIFAEIRRVETHYLPVVLRNTLVASNQWGAVRVLPETDPSVDLLIQGTIVRSDGANLILQVRATDSSGKEWLNKTYVDAAGVADYPDFVPSLRDRSTTTNLEDPFQDLHAQIANDLLAVRESMDSQALLALAQLTQMKYAGDLSPEAFGSLLQPDAQGLLTLQRLPATNDPLLEHVAQIRARHHVFIDTIDEYYDALHHDLKPTYDVWRQYSHDQVVEEEESAASAAAGGTLSGSGSFEALSQNYNRYKWAKIFEQEFVALASGFVSETAPAVLKLSENVNGLTGPVEEQYAQWRVLLRELFEVETVGLSQ